MTAPSSQHVVLDSSAAISLLADAGAAGQWVAAAVSGASLLAPDLMPFEVSNVLRRHVLAGILDSSSAALAHADLVALPLDLYPYTALADRIWQLRTNLTAYDAAYVALAELVNAPLVTLDGRLSRTPGIGCRILAYATGRRGK
jgi:predicted nucleic acid-binding protein